MKRTAASRPRRHLRSPAFPLVFGAALAVSGCFGEDEFPELEFTKSETAVEYDVDLSGVTLDPARELIYQALDLYRRQEDGAQSIAFLRRRAQGDVATVQKILRSYGYFESEVEIDVDNVADLTREEREAAGLDPDAPVLAEPQDTDGDGEMDAFPRAVARVIVMENRRYTLAAHSFDLTDTGAGPPPALPDAAALGSPVGGPARADRILSAEKQAVADFRAAGRPYARQDGRDAVADPETATLEVETTIATGDQYVFGGTSYEGVESVDLAYLDTYRPYEEGRIVDPELLVQFQQDLIETGLFNAGSASLPTDAPAGGVAPVTVALEEAPPRTVAGGVRYNTDTGPAVRGAFTHRNLFGANETLAIEALVGLEEQSLDNRLRIPQWGRPGQDLVFGLNGRRIQVDAFDELGVTLSGGVEREITPELTIGFGGLAEYSQITADNGERISKLAGLPAFVYYDTTDDLLDPSQGFRARVTGTPFAGFIDDTPVTFGIIDGSVSTYFDLTGDERYILASRARLGSAIAGDLDIVAANRRLYSGGGGSVRGYGEREIGPLDSNGDPTGGLSVAELGLELRTKFTDTIGAAGFVEAGSVSEDVVPTFSESVQVAVGGGLRYFSPVGPLRVDVGVPVNPRPEDSRFQVYISIGQAF